MIFSVWLLHSGMFKCSMMHSGKNSLAIAVRRSKAISEPKSGNGSTFRAFLSRTRQRPMQELLLRLFAGGYNTLTDTAICWIEPTDQALFDAVDSLEDAGISASDEEFMEVFNAWLLSICDSAAALGHTVPDAIRQNVRGKLWWVRFGSESYMVSMRTMRGNNAVSASWALPQLRCAENQRNAIRGF